MIGLSLLTYSFYGEMHSHFFLVSFEIRLDPQKSLL